MLEHMHKMMSVKDEKHGLGWQYIRGTWCNRTSGPGATELACLKVENKGLVDKNVELQESLLRHQEEADACLSLVLKSLTSKPPSS
ncbi:hypothetical protein KY289_030298 [Solanum tuberosum]|nr:hypothetical protein KY289_030298 [Solanum tuberosum]